MKISCITNNTNRYYLLSKKSKNNLLPQSGEYKTTTQLKSYNYLNYNPISFKKGQNITYYEQINSSLKRASDYMIKHGQEIKDEATTQLDRAQKTVSRISEKFETYNQQELFSSRKEHSINYIEEETKNGGRQRIYFYLTDGTFHIEKVEDIDSNGASTIINIRDNTIDEIFLNTTQDESGAKKADKAFFYRDGTLNIAMQNLIRYPDGSFKADKTFKFVNGTLFNASTDFQKLQDGSTQSESEYYYEINSLRNIYAQRKEPIRGKSTIEQVYFFKDGRLSTYAEHYEKSLETGSKIGKALEFPQQ